MSEGGFFLFIFTLCLLAIILFAGIGDALNPGEICAERNYGAEAFLYPEKAMRKEAYWCLRVVDGTPEAASVKWVEDNCTGAGVCVDD